MDVYLQLGVQNLGDYTTEGSRSLIKDVYLQLGEQNQEDDTREGSSCGLIKDCLEESIQVLKKSTTQSLHKLEKELGLLGSVLDQIPRKPDYSCFSNYLIIFHRI